MSKSMSTSPVVDPMVDLIDFSEYENSYQSPSLSPVTASKASFARPVTTASATQLSLLSTSQPLSGPSHQYDLYKQQTGIVPGALANTLAVNQNNSQITGYNDFNLDYLGVGSQGMFDFNTSPSQNTMNTSDMDMEFDSPSADPSFFFQDSTVNPSAICGQDDQALPSPPVVPTQTSNVGRMWPGMHQQAAMAKAQAQQRQQQQVIQQQQQQQQQQRQNAQPQPKQHRAKSSQSSDPIVEQKISQLLNSMRANPMSPDAANSPLLQAPRLRKDEEDMDEDERLLASEEGKKLSSKERRQLRNKVSARAFRSRRKEYISQLESEIAGKVTENGDLRAQNRALTDENKRLTDLTRMLLSSPSFSDFLDRLSANPQQLPQAVQPAPQVEQRRPENRQAPKDVNVYAAQQQLEHQQIGMAMIPEQNLSFSMLNMGNDNFSFEPQVFAVLETPEVPIIPIDSSVLSGKSSNFVGEQFDSDEEKVEVPLIERPIPKEQEKPTAPAPVNEEFESDPAFALYHDAAAPSASSTETRELDPEALSHVDLFGGIEPEKALSRYELVDADEEDAIALLAAARVQRITSSLDSLCSRLEMLTADL